MAFQCEVGPDATANRPGSQYCNSVRQIITSVLILALKWDIVNISTSVAQYHPSVHVYALPRHVTGVFRSKERRHLGDLFWCLLAA